MMRVDGYRATLLTGTPIFENCEDTDARSGRLAHAGRPAPGRGVAVFTGNA